MIFTLFHLGNSVNANTDEGVSQSSGGQQKNPTKVTVQGVR